MSWRIALSSGFAVLSFAAIKRKESKENSPLNKICENLRNHPEIQELVTPVRDSDSLNFLTDDPSIFLTQIL